MKCKYIEKDTLEFILIVCLMMMFVLSPLYAFAAWSLNLPLAWLLFAPVVMAAILLFLAVVGGLLVGLIITSHWLASRIASLICSKEN